MRHIFSKAPPLREIEGISGWQAIWPLCADLPADLMEKIENCESPIEQLMVAALGVVCLVCNGPLSPKIDVQVPIGRYRADIVLANHDGTVKAVVECDGEAFHRDTEKDAKRTKEIEARGYKVLRRTGSQIHHNPLVHATAVAIEAGVMPMNHLGARALLAAHGSA